jgi:hypothetical protein
MLAEIRWDVGSIAVVATFAVPIVAIVTMAWYRATKTTSENQLIRRMVERGMSVEEIERVLAARTRHKDA